MRWPHCGQITSKGMNMTHGRRHRLYRSLLVALGIFPWGQTISAVTDNLSFRGTLVTAPCTIRTGDDALELDFGDVVSRYLYMNTRTQGQEVTLHLEDCDTSVLTGVKIMFTGIENSQLPGLLALDTGSSAQGIAVGMETMGGTLLPLNVAGAETPLNADLTEISLKAYVQAEPGALSTSGILPGSFRATALFELEYQ